MVSHRHPNCTFQKTNHIEGKTSLQITDSLTKVSNHFPLCATEYQNYTRCFISWPLNTSPSLLFQIPQITLVLSEKIACSSKLLKDDKDGQDTETPVVTEQYSSFFPKRDNVFCSIISQMLTLVGMSIHPRVSSSKTDDKSFSHKCLPETWLNIQKAGKRIVLLQKHLLSNPWQCLTSYRISATKLF